MPETAETDTDDDIEFLDEVPEGFVYSPWASDIAGCDADVAIIERRWRSRIGPGHGADDYVPYWAHRIMNDFMMDSFANAAFPIVERLAALDAESQRAAMTVLELGGMRELARFVEMSEDFIAENITSKTLA